MISKRIATLLAAVAVTAASPAFSQAAAPMPARESSLQGSAQAGEGSTTVAYVVAAIVLGGLVYGLVKFLDDDDGDDVPVSP
ncbi:hypothetical protein [Allosphingosinicella sp.]|uniref:hypothetical protein n=1 Tax=Allosphingosinicella sp. TaxID=2823234 RepID=UPI002FC115F0